MKGFLTKGSFYVLGYLLEHINKNGDLEKNSSKSNEELTELKEVLLFMA
jgi:hypothetical protein